MISSKIKFILSKDAHFLGDTIECCLFLTHMQLIEMKISRRENRVQILRNIQYNRYKWMVHEYFGII